MKKLLSSFLTAMVLILVCFPVASFAKAIFNIAVSPTTLSLARNTSGSFNVTVTNVSGASFAGGLTYTANILTPTLFTSSMGASTCGASLGNGQSCSFTVNVQAGATTGTDNLAPRVCFLQEACTSLPSTNFAHVTVIRTPPTPSLTSISVSPSGTSLQTGGTQQFTATGTFSDGSTANISSTAQWAIVDDSVATVNSTGLVTAVSAGTTTVNASQGGFSSSAMVTVSERFAYIANANFGTGISICLINSTTGGLSNCIGSNPGSTFVQPTDIKIDSPGTFAYIANSAANTVSQCALNSATGALSNCVATNPGLTFNTPTSIALFNSGGRAYVTNRADNTISICDVDEGGTGLITNCSSTNLGGGLLNDPFGVVVKNPSEDFVYISNFGDSTVIVCAIDHSTGALSGCQSTGSLFAGPTGITMDINGNIIYVVNNGNQTVTRCSANFNTGLLSNCIQSSSAVPNLSNPRGMVINTFRTRAYVTNATNAPGGNKISQCDVNTSTGELSNCVPSDLATLDFATGITLK